MITTIEAIAIAKKYLSDKGWEYLYIVEDKVWFDTNQKIPPRFFGLLGCVAGLAA